MNSAVRFVAHRGYSAQAPENTPAAFQAALDFRQKDITAYGIELDVMLSGDDRVVVFHDGDLKRMCGSDNLVRELSYEELARVSANSPQMGCQAIPLFSDVLRQVDHRRAIYCEVKVNDCDAMPVAQKLAELLEAYRPAGDIVLHSFNANVLGAVHQTCGGFDAKFGLLFGNMDFFDTLKPGQMLYLDYLHPEYHLLLAEPSRQRILAHGLKINTWTVDRREDLRSLLSLEASGRIEGVITNDLSIVDEVDKK